MGKWEMVRWEQVLQIKNGKNQKAVESSSGVYPIYGSGGIMGYANDYICPEKTTIIGRKGSINSPIYAEQKFWNVDTAFGLVANSNLDSKFLYYFCVQYNFQRHNKAVTIPSLTKSDLLQISMPFPPLDEQKRIAKNLDLASEIVKGYKEQLAELDKLVQSVFYEMFGDPVTNEKGWALQKLGNLCDISRGGSPRPIDNFLGGNIPWIKIGDATKGDDIYLKATKEHIIEEGVKKSRLIKSGGLIFANCGVSLGFARIITFDGCIHDGWLAFENVSKTLNEIFLLKSLNFCTDYFRRIAPDGTQPNLNTSIMKNFYQILPPPSLQIRFVEIVTEIENQKTQIQQALTEAENLFNSLMQEYFE